jgi:hypothetical protein
MTLTVDLPPATLEQLCAESKASGTPIEDFVREAIEAKLQRRRRSFADVAAPIQAAVEASGMSEEAVDQLFESELKAMRAEKRALKNSQ